MNYSEQLYTALHLSRQEAERLGNTVILPVHLLLGILRLGKGKACELLQASGADLNQMKTCLEDAVQQTPEAEQQKATEIAFDEQTERILRIMENETKAYKTNASDTEHLLMAILKEYTNPAATLLERVFHITYNAMEGLFPKPQQMPKIEASNLLDDEEDEDTPPSFGATSATTTSQKKNNADKSFIDRFSHDLTDAAQRGMLDPVIGRDNEIERIVQILSRRKKNNPILIGEPGVGKSAIVEGLAMRIVRREVSPLLFEKRILALDITSMVAGTKYRGQFEERVKSLIDELKKTPDIILFIDEIHTLVGAGNQAGQLDAANILKPALARGEVQCIGATTLNEYRTSIEKDGALERRFQKIIVPPTTREQTLSILQQLAPKYSEHHHVTYSTEVLQACIDLADRYITDRTFPDKAIDVMDEVGARTHVAIPPTPEAILQAEKEINRLQAEKQQVIEEQNFERAVALRDQEGELQKQLQAEIKRWEEQQTQQEKQLTTEDVATVVSLMSGVPVQRIASEENVHLRQMALTLTQRVIGQEEAVQTVVRSIQRSRVGLKDPNRPIGTFLFLGPTGVGKTYLAQCLAEEMFGSRDALIRLDMSEYMEKHAVSLLVGAPPGYVGHEEAGKLTEAVRRKPYSIVLFDEIEKAHPDIFNILLQLLDEGRLTDRQGVQVDFKNTIIILSSNVGTRQLKDFGAGIGFAASTILSENESKQLLQKALQKTFSPEFLNRIDNIVTFKTLEKEALQQILHLELEHLTQRLNAMGYTLTITEEATDYLLSKGYDAQYGARPLKRVISTELEDALTEHLLTREESASKNLTATMKEGKIWVLA